MALVAIAAVGQPSSPLGTRPINTKPWWSPTIINVKDYNCKGDGHTDDTLCLQRAVNAAAVVSALGNGPGFVYLPATGRYAGYVFSSLTVNGDVFFIGVLPGDGSLDFGGALISNVVHGTGIGLPAISMNSTTWGFQNLIFRTFAGWGGNITGTTSSTITFDALVSPDLTTMNAHTITAAFTFLTQNDYYTDGIDVFRFLGTTNTQPAANQIPAIGTVPNDGAAHSVNGLSWIYVAHGTTFAAGNFGAGQQWYYFGSTANSITGVVPAPGQNLYADPTLIPGTITRGYFSSLQHNSTTTRTAGFINGTVGQDPVITHCWFNGMSGAAVFRANSMQGGIWTENVIDQAQYGVYGDLTNLKLTNNRFFGCTKAGVFTASTPAIGTGGADINNNYFQLNPGAAIQLDDGGTYAGAVTGSAIAGISIKNNYSNQDTNFLVARGVAHMTVEGNRISRTARDVMKFFGGIAYSRIANNHIDGAGESQRETPSTFYAYIHVLAASTFISNLIAANTFSYLNAGQATNYAVQFDGGATLTGNIVQDNEYLISGVAAYVANYNAATATLPIFANNAAALAGGLTAGLKYRTGGDPDIIAIVH